MAAQLVAIGDSLTQGFQSGAIHRTGWSYPAMVAKALNHGVIQDFKYPDFGPGSGLPLNLEELIRKLPAIGPSPTDWWNNLVAAVDTHKFLRDEVACWEEAGEGTRISPTGPIHHNLAIWGFTLGDCRQVSANRCSEWMTDHHRPLEGVPVLGDFAWDELGGRAMYRTAIRTLNPSGETEYGALTQVAAAKEIARVKGGIENLIFWLGANNCLGSVTRLPGTSPPQFRWSDSNTLNALPHEQSALLWKVGDFQKLADDVFQEIKGLDAKNVYVGTIPHVTIPPVTRGHNKDRSKYPAIPGRQGRYYYDDYTYFWTDRDVFLRRPEDFPRLTATDAQMIDDVIDSYNATIREHANANGWHVVDLCGVLDALAIKRNQGDVRYPIPAGLHRALATHEATKDKNYAKPDGSISLDTRYLKSDGHGTVVEGGLFSLDGIHPTTIGYGIIAYEFLKAMKGREFAESNLNWNEIVGADSLVTDPPPHLMSDEQTLDFLWTKLRMSQVLSAISGHHS